MSTDISIPTCVGIIMDGNRRWAKQKGLPTFEGHRAGGKTLKEIVSVANTAGVQHVIFFAFSTENWKRSEEEVSYLLNLIEVFIEQELDYFNSQNGVMHYVGDLSRFSPRLQKAMSESVEKTKHNSGLHVHIALNYGGRQEIVSAIQKMVREHPEPEQITEEYISQRMQTADMPDPDIIIRTSGEQRLSGFLPWQGVYSELFFTDTLWPDFSTEEFLDILRQYGERERRHGK